MLLYELKVGDTVTCVMFGKGKVISIIDTEYPINVMFDNDLKQSYTEDGRWLDSVPVAPTLYKGRRNVEVKVSDPLPELPDFKCGDWIAVGFDEGMLEHNPLYRQFLEFKENGEAVCVAGGRCIEYYELSGVDPTKCSYKHFKAIEPKEDK